MTAATFLAIFIVSILSCPVVTVAFGVLAGFHSAVGACAILLASATVSLLLACIQVNRFPPERV